MIQVTLPNIRNAAPDRILDVALPCHLLIPSRCAVSRSLLTAFALLASFIFASPKASADIIAGAGVSGAEALRPFNSLSITQSWERSGWDFSFEGNGRIQTDSGLGDAIFNSEGHAETALSIATLLELDAAYGFDRERTRSIKQEHSFGADVGLRHVFQKLTVKADAGFESFFHRDTTQPGFRPIDRAGEDFTEAEAALRVTFSEFKSVMPFLEAAYVRRDYFKNPGREFDGPEFVAGVTFAVQHFSGDFGAIYALRSSALIDTTHALGPYVDLKWKPYDKTDISLAMSAGIDQDTTGLANLYPYYSARLEVTQALTENLTMSAVLDTVLEDRVTGRETEINPTIKLAWSGENGFGLHASAGLTHTRIEGEDSTTEPSFELGMSWTWDRSKSR